MYILASHMEGVTGKGSTFDCYFGSSAQGKAIFASGTMQFNLYFPVAGNYYYEIICHNQWNASKKTMELWIDDDTDSASKHSDYPSNPSEAPLTGSLVVPTSGLHRLNLKGSLAIVRLKIRGIAPVPFGLAGPADGAINVIPEGLVFDWTQNSDDTSYYAVPNGAQQFTITVDTQSDFNSGDAYTKIVTAAD